MTQDQFLKLLISDEFPEPTLVEREAGGFLDNHAHSFEVKALVVSGQIDLVVDGVKSVYIAGDVFHLLPKQVHVERYGNKGVQYWASRKTVSEVNPSTASNDC